MIHTELYRVFHIVAKEKSITAASKVLHISQPAVSKSIKRLEEETGSHLFLRSKKGVQLTSEGQLLLEYVKKAFKSLDQAEFLLEKLNNNEEGVVRIGVSNTLFKYYLLGQLEGFHKLYPDIKIQIKNQSTKKTFELIEDGQVDFGIVCSNKIPEIFKFEKLNELNDIFVSNKEIKDSSLSCDFLEDEHVMLLEKGNHTRDFIDEYFVKNHVEIKPEIEISNMEFLVEMAKIGLGTACVIREFVKNEIESETLFELPIEPKPEKRKMGIAHIEKWPMTTSADLFVQYLKE